MKNKRFWLTFVVVFIAMEIMGYLIHSVILGSTYAMEDVAKIFRPMEEMNSLMWIMYVVDVVWAFFFVFIFTKGFENKGIMEGIRYGIYIGLFMELIAAYAQYVVYPLPYYLALQWFIYGFIECVILGLITSLLYKPTVPTPAEA